MTNTLPYDYSGNRTDILAINSSVKALKYSQISSYCIRNKITLGDFFIGAYCLFLKEMQQTSDVSFWLPFSSGVYDQQAMFGSSVNTGLFEMNDIDEHLTLEQFFHRVKVEVSKIEQKTVSADASISSGTLLNLHFPKLKNLVIENKTCERCFLRKETVINDIVFEIEAVDEVINVYCDARKSLYKLDTVEYWVEQFKFIIDSILKVSDADSCSIESLFVVNEYCLEKWNALNNTDCLMKFVSFNQSFVDICRKFPNRIAVIDSGKEYRFGELWSESFRISSRILSHKKTNKQEPILLFLDKSWECICSIVGVLLSGNFFIPVDVTTPLSRVKNIISGHNVQQVITNREHVHMFSGNVVCIEDILENEMDCVKGEDISSVEEKDIAYVIFTSGTTGTPKGVVISHKALFNLIEWSKNVINFNEEQRTLWVSSVAFDLSIFDTVVTLALGGTTVVSRNNEKGDLLSLANHVINEKVTIWNSAPQVFVELIDYCLQQKLNLRSLRTVMLSGDWIPTTLISKIFMVKDGTDISILALGGATEATVWSNCYEIDPQIEYRNYISIPYGRPIINARYYVLNPSMKLCPLCCEGELYISGDCLAEGYFNDDKLTSERFLTWMDNNEVLRTVYRTGDKAMLACDGNLRICGRVDEQVKVRGNRVELKEIQHVLSLVDGTKESCVLAKKDGVKTQLIAFVVSLTKDVEYYLVQLKSALPDYMIPQQIIFLDKIPLTLNGKIDKKELERIVDAQNDSRSCFQSAEIEKRIAQAFKFVLGIDSFSNDSNFFDYGDSAQAMELFVLLSKHYRVELKDIYKYNSISTLAEYIKNLEERK